MLRRRLLAAALFLCAAAPLWLAGCSNTAGTTPKGGDPLLGDPGGAPKPAPTPAATTSIGKPYSPPHDGNTPASLVGHTDIPGLSGSRPLSLEPGWQRDFGDKPTGPKVMPVPREKTPTPELLTTGGAWSADGKVTPLGGDPLARLTALGAVGIRQEAAAEGVRVSCFVPGGATPGGLTFLETTAASLPLAVEALVQRIGR